MTLDDFGVKPDTTPPRLQKEHPVSGPEGNDTVGYVGPMPNRGVYGFARPVKRGSRASPREWLFELDAYSIHDVVLSKVRSHGAQRIIVIETDRARTLEWPIRDFDNALPKKYGAADEGAQTYALCDHATEWPNHTESDVWIDDDVDVSRGYKKSHDWE